jgi:hypothetical protein
MSDDNNPSILNPVHNNTRGIKEGLTDFDHWQLITLFLLDLPVNQPFCRSRTGRVGMLSCNCSTVFENATAAKAVASYVVAFSKLKKIEKQCIVIKWIRYGIGQNRMNQARPYCLPYKDYSCYIVSEATDMIPFNEENEENEEAEKDDAKSNNDFFHDITICQSALMNIFGFGRVFWGTCRKSFAAGNDPTHGLVGKSSNRQRHFNEHARPALVNFFEGIKQFADPIATLVTRTITKKVTLIKIRNEEKGMVVLGPSWSKYNLYQRFCWERGFKIGHSNSSSSMKKRTDDQWISAAVADEESDTCSWKTFRNFWQREYSFLRILQPTRDICGECFKFSQKHKTRGGFMLILVQTVVNARL